MADNQQTISVPSLLILAALGAFAVRYFFFSPNSSSSSSSRNSSSSSGSSASSVNASHVEQVSSMFPQVPRRDIAWDLQRRGGSVQSTTERILMTGRLETAPAHYNPNLPPTTPSPQTSSSSTARQNKQQDKHIDLIERYNLSDKVGESSASSSSSAAEQSAAGKWSQNKGERQAMLQRRREEMILNARRKMEEKGGESEALQRECIVENNAKCLR